MPEGENLNKGSENLENKGSQTETKTGEGSVTKAPIDWTTVKLEDIPENLIKGSKVYKDVLAETIERRGTIKTYKERLAELLQEDAKDEDVPEEKPKDKDKKTANNDDMPEWAKSLVAKINSIDETNLEGWREAAGRSTGIKSATILKGLQGKTQTEVLDNAKKIASELGIEPPQSDSAVGNVTGERDKSLMERVRKINRGQMTTDIFDPDFAATVEGGIESY